MMRVTTIAHASVLIELGRDRILIDPIFADVFASGTLCFHPARSLDAEALIRATTILVVTHIHLDHFHPPTLAGQQGVTVNMAGTGAGGTIATPT